MILALVRDVLPPSGSWLTPTAWSSASVDTALGHKDLAAWGILEVS